MGNCLSSKKQKREITIGTFGLDNAGKTTITKVLKGELLEGIAPTVGFGAVSFESKRFRITIYDLGGGARIRDIWKNYFAEIYGIIFVVDASDRNRIDEVQRTFSNMAQHSKIQEKPILFLLNKHDVEGAVDEVDAKDTLNIGDTVNKYRSPCRVETCVGTKGTGKNCDTGIREGFQWLLDQIYNRFDTLDRRIAEDVSELKKAQEAEQIERAERVRRIREEREKSEDQSTPNQGSGTIHSNGLLELSNQNRIRSLPFEPLPQISEEPVSQKSSEVSSGNRKFSSPHLQEFLVTTTADVNSSERHEVNSSQMATGLGASETSVPRLPPISPRLVRRLPPLPDSRTKSDREGYENLAYDSETAVVNRKPSNSDDTTQLSDITHKRKRKKKRLHRFQKVGASDDSDDNSNKTGPEIDLARLPSSEPRPPTPPKAKEEKRRFEETGM